MSRGHGLRQRSLLALIQDADGATTFQEIAQALCPQELSGSVRRSMRRALKGLVDEGAVLALGAGGRGEPHRYCINPLPRSE